VIILFDAVILPTLNLTVNGFFKHISLDPVQF